MSPAYRRGVTAAAEGEGLRFPCAGFVAVILSAFLKRIPSSGSQFSCCRFEGVPAQQEAMPGAGTASTAHCWHRLLHQVLRTGSSAQDRFGAGVAPRDVLPWL